MLLLAALLSASPLSAEMLHDAPAARDHAVLINVTEDDLNRLLVDSFRANGGPRFEGHKAEVSRGVDHANDFDRVGHLSIEGQIFFETPNGPHAKAGKLRGKAFSGSAAALSAVAVEIW